MDFEQEHFRTNRMYFLRPQIHRFPQSWSHIFTRTSNAAGGNTAWLVIPRPVPALAWRRTSLSAWATIPCVSFWSNYRPRSTVPAYTHANFSPKRPWRPVRKRTSSPQSRHSCPAVSQSASPAHCRCIVSPWSSKVFSLVLLNPFLLLTVFYLSQTWKKTTLEFVMDIIKTHQVQLFLFFFTVHQLNKFLNEKSQSKSNTIKEYNLRPLIWKNRHEVLACFQTSKWPSSKIVTICQLYSFNQAINDYINTWSSSPTKKRSRIRSHKQQIFFIESPEIGDWLSLSSGYFNSILKDTLYREQVGRVWKWVILTCVGSKPFPDLPSTIYFRTLAAFDYFFSYFDLIIYPPAILPSSQNREKAQREWQFWLEGK